MSSSFLKVNLGTKVLYNIQKIRVLKQGYFIQLLLMKPDLLGVEAVIIILKIMAH